MNIRQYKKKYAICRDDNGKMIYAGDIVEVFNPLHSYVPHKSMVFWSALMGAWIDSHPAQKLLSQKENDKTPLYLYLNQKPINWRDDSGVSVKKNGYCKKIKSYSFRKK